MSSESRLARMLLKTLVLIKRLPDEVYCIPGQPRTNCGNVTSFWSRVLLDKKNPDWDREITESDFELPPEGSIRFIFVQTSPRGAQLILMHHLVLILSSDASIFIMDSWIDERDVDIHVLNKIPSTFRDKTWSAKWTNLYTNVFKQEGDGELYKLMEERGTAVSVRGESCVKSFDEVDTGLSAL